MSQLMLLGERNDQDILTMVVDRSSKLKVWELKENIVMDRVFQRLNLLSS